MRSVGDTQATGNTPIWYCSSRCRGHYGLLSQQDAVTAAPAAIRQISGEFFTFQRSTVNRITCNFDISLPLLTGAQQLLRWATAWRNIHGPKSGGLLCPLPWVEPGPHLTQCGLGRGLPPYQMASWSIQLFGHNTPTLQTDRQTGQRSRSIYGRTVTCNGRP